MNRLEAGVASVDALTYDSVDSSRQWFFRERARRVAAAVLRARPRIVRDVGCGTGYVSALLQSYGLIVNASDIDPSNAAATHARGVYALVEDGISPRTRVLTLDSVSELSLEGFYDVVLFGNSLEHLEHPTTQLSLAHAITRHDGRVVVSVTHRYSIGNLLRRACRRHDNDDARTYSRRQLINDIRNAGWTIVRVEYANYVPHCWRAPASVMRRAERLRDHALTERLGETMIVTGAKP